MAKTKKVVTVLSTAAVAGLITTALGSTAFAKASGVLVNNGDKNYRYDLSSLNSSFTDYSNDSKQGALYQDYVSKITSGKVTAVYDDKQSAYIDFAKISSDFSDAVQAGKTFDLNAYTESSKNTVTENPATIYDATVGTDGKVAYAQEQTPFTKLAVSSVSVLNAKQVKVTFNKNIDTSKLDASNFTVIQSGKDSLGNDRLSDSKDATNYVSGASAGTGSVTAVDNQTVVLTLDDGAKLDNGSTVSVTTTGVKDTDGTTMADITSTVTLQDLTAPTVVKAESVGSNKVKVTFSEPIYDGHDSAAEQLASDFSINDGGIYVSSALRDAKDPCAVVLTTGSDLVAGTQYTVKANPSNGSQFLEDFANISLIKDSSVTFTHTVNSTAPTVTGVSKSETKIRLTFSKKINLPASGNSSNVEFRYAYNSTNAQKVTAADLTLVSGTDNQYDLTLPSNMVAGSATLYIHYNNDADAAKDNVITDDYGNVLANDTAVSFTVNNDTTAPTATISYHDATTLYVDFSKAVANYKAATNYTIIDPNGNAVPVTSIGDQDSSTNRVILTVPSMSEGGAYKVSVGGTITDTSVNANKLVAVSTTLSVPDTKAPTIGLGDVVYNPTDAKIYVNYSEPMASTGSYSAVDANNYRLSKDGGITQSKLPDGTTLSQNGKVVTISLPKALTTEDTLVIGQVADLAGNKMAALQNPIGITNSSVGFNATLKNIKATNKKTIQFTVNDQIKSVDRSLIDVDGSLNPDASTVVNNADGTSTVTVSFNSDTLASDLTGASITVKAGALTDLNNIKNQAVPTISKGTADTDMLDYIAPSITNNGISIKDTDGNGKLDTVTITYDEPLYVASVSDNAYTVEGYTIKSVDVLGSTVTLKLDEKANSDLSATPKVTQVGTVEDKSAQHNVLSAQPAQKATPDHDTLAITPVFNAVNAITGGSTAASVKVAADTGNVTVTPTFATSTKLVDSPMLNVSNFAGVLGTVTNFTVGTHSVDLPSTSTLTADQIKTAAESVKAAIAAEFPGKSYDEITVNDLLGRSISIKISVKASDGTTTTTAHNVSIVPVTATR